MLPNATMCFQKGYKGKTAIKNMACNDLDRKSNLSRLEMEVFRSRKPSLDTDIMDFLARAGCLCYWEGPLYQEGDSDMKQKIRDYVTTKRSVIPSREKARITRFMTSVRRIYLQKEHKTLNDLKTFIEEEGVTLRGMGYKGLAEFNKLLRKYEIEPFKVGGKYAYKKTLQKYGLLAK